MARAEEYRQYAAECLALAQRAQLGFAEKAIVKLVHAAEGDYRDWDAVHEWSAAIAKACALESAR